MGNVVIKNYLDPTKILELSGGEKVSLFQNATGTVRSVQILDRSTGQFVNLGKGDAVRLRDWLNSLDELKES
jgi:hypothetical protein